MEKIKLTREQFDEIVLVNNMVIVKPIIDTSKYHY